MQGNRLICSKCQFEYKRETIEDTAAPSEAEIALAVKLGECAGDYQKLLMSDKHHEHEMPLTTEIRKNDIVEFVDKIHQLQHAVMARTAARARPDIFRK